MLTQAQARGPQGKAAMEYYLGFVQSSDNQEGLTGRTRIRASAAIARPTYTVELDMDKKELEATSRYTLCLSWKLTITYESRERVLLQPPWRTGLKGNTSIGREFPVSVGCWAHAVLIHAVLEGR